MVELETKDSNKVALGKYRELASLFETKGFMKDFKEALDNPFEVMLMAPMSSGKSTLINAMLGFDLLPTANQACTATVYRVEDNDAMKTFKCRAAFGDKITAWNIASSKLLKEWNLKNECNLIEIDGNLQFIRNVGAKLVLYDTPGPNYSCDKQHSETMKRALTNHQFGVIVFLLNANNLGTDDERIMLNQILEIRKSNKKFHKRTVFVVSKADQFDEEDGENLKQIVSKVKSYLKDVGFKSPKIIPIMAEAALLIRKLSNNLKLSKHEQLDLMKYIDQVKLSPTAVLNSTRIDKEIIETVQSGIEGFGYSVSQNGMELKEFSVRKDFSVSWSELNRYLYSTGLHTLELYLESLITKQALPKTMVKVGKVLKKYGAKSLHNWIKSE
jgi:GTPase Era involved in 16S rRNA processing